MFNIIKTGYYYGKYSLLGSYMFDKKGWSLFTKFLFFVCFKLGWVRRGKHKISSLLLSSLDSQQKMAIIKENINVEKTYCKVRNEL